MGDTSDEEENNFENDEKFDEFVKIYSNDSELIALLGSVFHNDKSRKMWLLLSNTKKEFYLKEMAVIIENNVNPRLPNYEYHIGVMVKTGIVRVRIKLHNKHKTKFYRAAPVIMLASPQIYEKVTKSKTLKNAFNKVFKFAAIGIAAVATHILSESLNVLIDVDLMSEPEVNLPMGIYPLLVIIVGLITERIYSHFKK